MLRLALNSLFWCAATSFPETGELSATDFSEVIVIPDVHGDSDALLRSLYLGYSKTEGAKRSFNRFDKAFSDYVLSGIYPNETLSSRRDVALVQLGDLVDRGPDSAYCISIILAVQEMIGWKTVVLYGNHELLNMPGPKLKKTFVSKMDVLGFGSAAARSHSFMPGGYYFERMIGSFVGFARISSTDQNFSSASNPATLFVHGGINLDWIAKTLSPDEAWTLDDLNEEFTSLVQDETVRNTELGKASSVLWTREFTEKAEKDLCGDKLDRILNYFKVARIIVGHTPQSDNRAKWRCDGRIILADAAMSRWMNDDEEAAPVAIIISIDPSTYDLQSIVAHYSDLEGDNQSSAVLVGTLADMASSSGRRRRKTTSAGQSKEWIF